MDIIIPRYGIILKRGKNNLRSKARKICAFTLNRVYDIPVIEIANYFKISSPAISMMIAKGEIIIKNEKIKVN